MEKPSDPPKALMSRSACCCLSGPEQGADNEDVSGYPDVTPYPPSLWGGSQVNATKHEHHSKVIS